MPFPPQVTGHDISLSYSNITLHVCRFHAFDAKAVSSDDGADYLYTHYFIDVECIWNPFTTATQGGTTTQNPFFIQGGVAGDIAPDSIALLRHKLMQKRQSLAIVVGRTLFLQSPLFVAGVQRGVDANIGPNPLGLKVIAIKGEKTAIVRFQIETWLNEANPIPVNILSNRWTMSEVIDSQYYSTLHVDGRAIFRRDQMLANQKSVDAYRKKVVLPVPLGYQRQNLNVVQASDGCSLKYSYDDVQQTWPLDPGGAITKIKGWTEIHMDWRPGKSGIAMVTFPKTVMSGYVEAWGSRACTRNQLVSALAAVSVSTNVPGAIADAQVNMEYICHVDFGSGPGERHGSLRYSWFMTGWAGAFATVAATPSISGLKNHGTMQEFNSAVMKSDGTLASANTIHGGTRAWPLVLLFTQLLTAPDASPGQPQQPELDSALNREVERPAADTFYI